MNMVNVMTGASFSDAKITPGCDAATTAWFVSIADDVDALGRWSGPHSSEGDAAAAALELERLGVRSMIWIESNVVADTWDDRRRAHAVMLGRDIGFGMAAHARVEGLGNAWPGFDDIDREDLRELGFHPQTDLYLAAEQSARYWFARVIDH